MHRGYIKIYRKITENRLWNIKPFSKIQAFIDLIMMANHIDKTVFFRDQLIEVKRGQLVTSLSKLSIKWGWSRHKTKTCLDLVQKLDSIKYIIKDKRFMIITICNYDIYNPQILSEGQVKGQVKGQQKDNRRTTEGQQKDINNNYNNDNTLEVLKKDIEDTNVSSCHNTEEKNIEDSAESSCSESKNDSPPEKVQTVKIFKKESWPYKLADYLSKCIISNDPKFRIDEKKIQLWAKDMDKLIRIDKRDPEEIGHVIQWAQKDEFNKAVVLSASKLRKRYPELRLKYLAKKPMTLEERYEAGKEWVKKKEEEIKNGKTNTGLF